MKKTIGGQFSSTFKRKLIYIFRINDKQHQGYLKIGDATIDSSSSSEELIPSCHELNAAAKDRIDSYTSTAGIKYELLYTELAIYKDLNTGENKAFRDHKVHEVLKRSGFKKQCFNTNRTQNEWFKVDLETAKKAIKCVKENKTALDENQITDDKSPVSFRPEQLDAIDKTILRFKTHEKMLWNAKMRFGKTLSALQVVRKMQFNKTIIITHRPVVDSGWFEDFGKIFYDTTEYQYGSKNNGKSFKELIKSKSKIVYFASIQDLRGSEQVGGNYEKNDDIFDIDWDFVIVDEAHEGTQTNLGQSVIESIVKPNNGYKTYQLLLSGTPFNLLTSFESNDIYTWDYIMEQEAKKNWSLYHYGDYNPYDDLPRMNIFTYHLEKKFKFLDIEDKAFNFREFFRTWTGDLQKDREQIPSNSKIGNFVHEQDVKEFLKLICKKDKNTNYPFSTNEYKEYFRHSLWIVPGVKEARALSKLLKDDDSPFMGFDVVNVAGVGDEEVARDEALEKVRKAITKHPENTHTITLSCGKLTTGVSIPEWTAVLMLAGSYSTKASQYLQTIFRVQTPANIDGKIKEDAYVFDFAPDRTLKMVAEAVQLSARTKGGSNSNIQLASFLNYCPVIAIDGSDMVEYSVNHLLQELKKAYVDRVVRNGFDDPKIYNDKLLKLDEIELEEFSQLKKIIGESNQTKKTGEIEINKQGFDDEQWDIEEPVKKHPKRELTPEEKKILDELKEKKKNRDTAISILRGISIRMPLLVYGIDKDIDIDITVDNFASDELIDNQSWEEFMPKGVDKKTFKKFAKYYDKDVFVASSRRIRTLSKDADELEPLERIKKISQLFSTFKNPDKETVLTPWRVVNMHMSDCLGGYCFYNNEFNTELDVPNYVDNGEVTKKLFENDDSRILEINSKTGLYPLYLAYSIYGNKCKKYKNKLMDQKTKLKIWDEVIKQNIFVVCKTPMAKSITRRTLVGYRDAKTNLKYFEDLVNQIKEPGKSINFIKKLSNGKTYWKAEGKDDDMKFNAIVGNPPYQLMGGSGGNNDSPIYQYFSEVTQKMEPDYSSLIMPARWFTSGRENLLGDFRRKMTKNKQLKKLVCYSNCRDVFENVEIKGGICYYLIDSSYNGQCDYTLIDSNEKTNYKRDLDDFDVIIRKPIDAQIIKDVWKNYDKEQTLDKLISSDTPFGIPSNPKSSKKNLTSVKDSEDSKHNIKLYYIEKLQRKIGYVEGNKLTKNVDYIPMYKVFIPESGGSGNDAAVIGKPEYGGKDSVCSQSYLFVAFNTKRECENFIKYLKTKFLRALVSTIKISQSAPNRAYKYVPIVEFGEKSKINWDVSIFGIDKQLYKMFGLNDDEIKYIENSIKPLDGLYYEDSDIMYIKQKKGVSKCRIKNSKFVVLKGSYISKQSSDSLIDTYKESRKNINKYLDENDLLIQDIEFDYASAAASFVTGNMTNGNEAWKDASGKSLNDKKN